MQPADQNPREESIRVTLSLLVPRLAGPSSCEEQINDRMSSPDNPETSLRARVQRLWAHLGNFDFRDAWWAILDLVEARPWLRRMLFTAGILALLGAATYLWAYPWWRQRTAIGMARQWMEAGRLDHASSAVQDAMKVAPENPETWKLAADLARRLGNHTSARGYSQKASELAPSDGALALVWAADALLANQPEESERVLASLPASTLARSSHARRIAGELARRRLQLTAAREHFEAALRIDGPNTPVNEVPLGVILLNARDQAERRRGLDLLSKWTTSVEWGANALRSLLGDSLLRDDREAMIRWAEALRAHPRCTLGDIPNCLRALSRADEARFSQALAALKKQHGGDPANISILASWLNQIGRSPEAMAWVDSFPPELTRTPPVAVSAAEALRLQSDWPRLHAWTEGADWGRNLESVRLSYALNAARKNGQTSLAEELRKTLLARAVTDGERTLFTADALYAWGLREDAVALLWNVAEEPGISIHVLGTLARHYQVAKDAAGQFRVFKRLHSLRSGDPDIANNYAFFAALTGNDPRQSEEISRKNLAESPGNPVFLATRALVLCTQNRARDALNLFTPENSDWKKTPVITLAYGLSLAGALKKEDARPLLSSLDRTTLTPEEAALIENALR